MSISRGAFLHDIGQVPALRNILLQPELLLPDELALMCQLCTDVYKMLQTIPFLADASEIGYAYAERFDGTGYPRKLKGHEIPLGSTYPCRRPQDEILYQSLLRLEHTGFSPRRNAASIRTATRP